MISTRVSNLALLELQKSEAIFDDDLCLLIIFGYGIVLYSAVDSVPCPALRLAAHQHENITQLALCISISCYTAYYVSQRCYKGSVHETPRPGGPSSRHHRCLACYSNSRASFSSQIFLIKNLQHEILQDVYSGESYILQNGPFNEII